ncbi:Serine/threonine-protein phosphatase [Meloidogyne graminicola]|uniref:Serine/threonine-protein phosphatase n=1 Tax=Meloidogyne graminicola TaxID=189291 RepID=A0A8S9ZIV2_9BILA|nr:Serine/threonine-protein phosphatase [Meloidogyne graminicola]
MSTSRSSQSFSFSSTTGSSQGSQDGSGRPPPLCGIPAQIHPMTMPELFEIEKRRTKWDNASKSTELDVVEFIRRHLLRGKKEFHYTANQVEQIAHMAMESFEEQQTLIELNGPILVCGDIHGQYSDLLHIFHACGPPHKNRYLFLGDYVDRGRNSLEVICLLFACKVQYPGHIFMLRGNHEITHINRAYGFFDELSRRFGNDRAEELWLRFNDAFAYMPLAATIGGKILCMHGGISPHLRSLNDIRDIKRPIPVIIEPGLIQDLLWADPNLLPSNDGFVPNHFRNCSVLFSEEALKKTMTSLKINLILRAHQVAQYGYDMFCGQKMITIFSAPRYHPELNNWGAVANVSADLEIFFILTRPSEAPQKQI